MVVNGKGRDVIGSGYPTFIVVAPYFDNRSDDNCGRTYIFRLKGYSTQLGRTQATIKLFSDKTGFIGCSKIYPTELSIYSAPLHPFLDVSMLSRDTVWIVGKGGIIMSTRNFTSSTPYWYLHQSGTDKDLYSIVMTHSGGVVSGDETILYSTNGENWYKSLDSDIEGYLWRSICYDGSRLWCVGTQKDGDGIKIISSMDMGISWEEVYTLSTGEICSIDFYGMFGVAVGNGIILCTRDGGYTWRVIQTQNLYNDVVVISETIAVLVGKYGKILRTTDGGTTWSLDSSTTYQNLLAVDALNTDEIVAVGENGTILRYDGVRWRKYENTNSTQNLYSIFLYSSNLYCAVGNVANILKYDGEWKIRYLPAGDRIDFMLTVSGEYLGGYVTIYYNYSSYSNIEFKALGNVRCRFGASLKSSDGIVWQYTYQRLYKYRGEKMGFEINVSFENSITRDISLLILEIYDVNGTRYYFVWVKYPQPYFNGSKNATFRIVGIDYSLWPSGIYYAIFTAYDADFANDYQAGLCDQKVVWFAINAS